MKKEKVEEISLKNTKQEILDALNAALEREKDAKNIKYEPEKEVEKIKKETAVKETKENVKNNIFSEELNKKFNDLEIAIKAEEEKLKNLYDIEGELNNMIVVVNASREAIATIEKERSIKESEMKEKLSSLEEEYNNKLKELETNYQNEVKKLKLERDREVEEYNYNTKRNREIDNNKWLDEKEKREKELRIKEIETERLLKDAKEKENYLKDLEIKIEEMPSNLEKEYQKGKDEMSKEMTKEHKYEVELLKKDFNSTIERQKDRISSLEEEIKKYSEMNSSLGEKLDKAYSEIKDMATRTVEANGGVKILGNSNSNDNK